MMERYIIAWLLTFIGGSILSTIIQLLHVAGWLKDWEYKWVEVSIGVVVSLIASPIFLPWEVVFKVGGLFVASGIPMVAGAIARYIWLRRQQEKREEEDI